MTRGLLSCSFFASLLSASTLLALAGTPITNMPKPAAPAGKVAAAKAAPAKAVAFADVMTVIKQQCLGCHNAQTSKGKLNVESHETLLRGGDGGAIIVAGKAAESRMVKHLEGALKPQMPMNAPPLPGATIALIKQWIDQGARSGTVAAGDDRAPVFNVKRVAIDVCVPITLGESKTQSDELTFNADIAAILQANCGNCHGTENPRAQLRLNSFDTVMAGGKSGVPVKVGDTTNSLLIKRIEGTEGRKMPLNGSLSQPDIDRIKKWIEQGAKRGLPESNRGPEMLVAIGPIAQVTALAFNPEGKWLALGFYKRVIVLELPGGKLVKTLDDHMGTVHDLQFSNDGKHLAVAGGASGVKGEVKIWDTATWNTTASITAHADTVFSVAFNSDGKRLVSGSNDKTVRVWELPEGKALHTFKDPADAVFAVAYSPDGNYVAGGGADKTVKVWKLGAGLERTLTQTTDSVTAVTFNKDGSQIVGTGLDGVVRRWVTSSGQNVANMGHGEKVQSLALMKDGFVASGGADRNVKIWNTGNGLARTLGGHTDWVVSVAASPDGKYLASGSADGVVRLFAIADGRPLASLVFAPMTKPGEEPAWLFVTGEGYFDGSPELVKLAKWRVRGEVRSGDPMAPTLNKPDMVQKALALQPVDAIKLDLVGSSRAGKAPK